MTLPNDGWPRISSEGIAILKEGLAGDFSRREKVGYLNHPMCLPSEHVENASIQCDPDEMHFSIAFWYGEYPKVKDACLAPHFTFNKIDDMATYDPGTGYIRLTMDKGDVWDWYSSVAILVDDAHADERRKTDYTGAGRPTIEYTDEDGEDYPMDGECPYRRQETVLSENQKSLEAWL